VQGRAPNDWASLDLRGSASLVSAATDVTLDFWLWQDDVARAQTLIQVREVGSGHSALWSHG
jgi:hypothetical protein